jgi:hypothetical protein
MIAVGPCWACRRTFGYDPDLVPSVPIDPHNGKPPDIGSHDGTPGQVRARSIRQPLCPECVATVNDERAARGLPLVETEDQMREKFGQL